MPKSNPQVKFSGLNLTLGSDFDVDGQPTHFHREMGRAYYTTYYIIQLVSSIWTWAILINPVLLSRTLKKIPVTSKDRKAWAKWSGAGSHGNHKSPTVRSNLQSIGTQTRHAKVCRIFIFNRWLYWFKIKWGAYCRCPQWAEIRWPFNSEAFPVSSLCEFR